LPVAFCVEISRVFARFCSRDAGLDVFCAVNDEFLWFVGLCLWRATSRTPWLVDLFVWIWARLWFLCLDDTPPLTLRLFCLFCSFCRTKEERFAIFCRAERICGSMRRDVCTRLGSRLRKTVVFLVFCLLIDSGIAVARQSRGFTFISCCVWPYLARRDDFFLVFFPFGCWGF